VSLTPVNSFLAVSLTPAKNFRLFGYFLVTSIKFFAGVIDTAEQFIAGVIREYLRKFSKKFKTAPMEYLGAWGTLIHERNLKSKISCHTPFKWRKQMLCQLPP
jgi:hypothetical protein